MNDERWEGNACFHSDVEHTRTLSLGPFRGLTRLTLKSCTGPTGLSSGRLVTGRVDTKIRFYRGYHARLRATVTEFSSSLRSHPSLRPGQCGSRSWVALPPNKLSPPRHLHKSIKSVLVEFEPSSSRARYLPIRDAYRRGRKCSTDVRLRSLVLLGGKVVSSSYFLSSSFFI